MPTYTQAVVVSPAAITTNYPLVAVGTPVGAYHAASASFTVTYTTTAVGNLVILTTGGFNISGVAGTASGGWTLLQYTSSGYGGGASIWAGQVTTGTTTDTLTLTGSGSGSVDYEIFQFTSTGTSYGFGGPAALFSTSLATSTPPWAVPASLPSPGGTGPPSAYTYLGINQIAGEGDVSYTPGAGYTSIPSGSGNSWATFDVGITTAASPAPLSGANLGVPWTTVGVYAYASATTTSGVTTTIPITPVPMGKSWVVSQVAFTILPATTTTTAMANVQLNGRLLYGNTNANGGFVQGPPYVTISAGDAILITGTGLPASSSMIIEMYYNEYPAGMVPAASNTV